MKIFTWQQPVPSNLEGYNRLADLQDHIDRLFEAPLGEKEGASNLVNASTPALDVYQDKDHFTVIAELPGMRKEDIEVSLAQGDLSISGERKREGESGGFLRAERQFGRFQRTLTLPALVAADKISATYKDGVLTVTLPKAEEAKPRQIAVSVG